MPKILALCLAALAGAQDWNRFRGPNGSGVSDATGLPVEFGARKNLVWRAQVPAGRSSPVVAKDRVYLTAVEGGRLATIAFDAQTGSVAWRRDLVPEHANKIYVGNDTATPTPASDGENLYAFFPDLGLVSIDGTGRERWRLKLGPFDSFYGVSSSPVVYENTVALVCDQRSRSFALAVDKETGSVRWRIERKRVTTEGYSTPTVFAPPGGAPQLIVTGSPAVEGFDLATGRNLWWIGKQGIYPIGSPVLSGDVLISVSAGSEKPEYPPFESFLGRLDTNKDGELSRAEFAREEGFKDHFGWLDADDDGRITRAEWDQKRQESVAEHGVAASRLGGTGDRTDASFLWRYKKSYSNLVTPLVYRDVLYLVKSGGIITTLNPRTGAVLKTGRTKEAIDEYFASPVAGDGKVYLASHSGKVTVLKAGPQWEILAVNSLEEAVQATPAIAGGRIYLRTEKALYCFGLAP